MIIIATEFRYYLRALSTLRGLRGVPAVPPLCRETQFLGQQMLNAPVGINGLKTNDESITRLLVLYTAINHLRL